MSPGGKLRSARAGEYRVVEPRGCLDVAIDVKLTDDAVVAGRAEERRAFFEGETAELVIDHPNYQARAVLEPGTQKSLVEDLTA